MTDNRHYIEEIYTGQRPTVQVRVEREGESIAINQFSSSKGISYAIAKAERFIETIKNNPNIVLGYEHLQIVFYGNMMGMFNVVTQEVVGEIRLNKQAIESMRIFLEEHDNKNGDA